MVRCANPVTEARVRDAGVVASLAPTTCARRGVARTMNAGASGVQQSRSRLSITELAEEQ